MADDEAIGRQVGGHFHGAVYRGTTRALGASPVRATATIPSKFETIINIGAKEKDGFGVRSHRFHAAETELPGPGNYFQPVDHTRFKPESGSKKGFGALVSNDKRFKKDRSIRPPGPGAYDCKRYQGEPKTKSFSKAPVSYQFAEKEKNGQNYARRREAEERLAPGPGQYRPALEVQPKKAAETVCCFRSTTDRFKRGVVPPKGPSPAPGQYGVVDFFDKSAASVANHGAHKGPGFQFKSRSARMPGMEGGPQHYGAPSVIYGEEMVNPASLVGPGSHHTPMLDLETKVKESAKHQSACFRVQSHDRFGKPTAPRSKPHEVPGPGAYTVPVYAFVADPRKVIGSTSAFVSASARLDGADSAFALARPPGPAYYTVDKLRFQAHKSFNLNARQKWI